tara:strand:- start:1162 stop:1992 length:831 start_codon:yes stop_codon:yes gene_type:complete
MSVRQHVKKIYNVQDDFGRLGVVSSWPKGIVVQVEWENGVSEPRFKEELTRIHGMTIGIQCNNTWSTCVERDMRLTRTVFKGAYAPAYYTRPETIVSTRRASVIKAQQKSETWWAVYIHDKDNDTTEIVNYVTLNKEMFSRAKHNDDGDIYAIWWAKYHPDEERWELKRPVHWKHVVNAWDTHILRLPQYMKVPPTFSGRYKVAEDDLGEDDGFIDELECPQDGFGHMVDCWKAKHDNLANILEILQKMTAHKSELSDENGKPRYGKPPIKLELNF